MTKVPQLSLFFFNADAAERKQGHYDLLLQSARFADENGFTAVWVPERHFQRFGGLYGSPSITGAALAVLTSRVSIRAGSVVLPLQNPLRVAEEWAMIDNLSNGRVAIAAASGWHVNDFVLSPNTYHNRVNDMLEKIDTIRTLWKGGCVSLPNGAGIMTAVRILPVPIQNELPIWMTGQSDETFFTAGKFGFNVLTANFILKNSINELRRKVGIYREASAKYHGRPGHVTLMAHTFVGESEDAINRIVRPALSSYIRINIGMQQDHSAGSKDRTSFSAISEREVEVMTQMQVNQNIQSPLSFIGTLDHCARQAEYLKEQGADEIACLIDFGVGITDVMASLARLSKLIATKNSRSMALA
jgi:natural product biosynthesis luciferase-like monooxygenase protein